MEGVSGFGPGHDVLDGSVALFPVTKTCNEEVLLIPLGIGVHDGVFLPLSEEPNGLNDVQLFQMKAKLQ